jgi:cytidylate kinase
LTDKFGKRGENRRGIVIAVDGPAASGKGTLAKALAAALGFAYLDTGALYRTVALLTLDHGGDPSKPTDVAQVLDAVKDITPAMLQDPRLRTADVADAAAKVAVIPEVREAVRHYQLDFARNPPGGEKGAVLDGRDIGTVVCPDAEVKFFVTAAAEERARRRFEELKLKDAAITYDTVLAEINDRDHRDATRTLSPLKAAADSLLLDTTKLSPAASLEKALEMLREKFPDAPGTDGPGAGGKNGIKPAP